MASEVGTEDGASDGTALGPSEPNVGKSVTVG